MSYEAEQEMWDAAAAQDMAPSIGDTVRIAADVIAVGGRPLTGTVVRMDPEFFDRTPGSGEVAVASVAFTWPLIVAVEDVEVIR